MIWPPPWRNSNAATGATVPPLSRADRRRVLLRSLSAIVLAPPFLAAIYFGFPYFDALVTLGGAIAAWVV